MKYLILVMMLAGCSAKKELPKRSLEMTTEQKELIKDFNSLDKSYMISCFKSFSKSFNDSDFCFNLCMRDVLDSKKLRFQE